MKIALYTDAYRPKIDGVSVSLESLASELQKRQCDFDIYAPYTPGDYSDPECVHRFRSVPLLFQPEFRFSIPIDGDVLKKAFGRDYSLIHSHSPGPLGILAYQVARFRDIPHFHTYHTLLSEYTHYVLNGRVISRQTATKLSVFWANRMNYLIAPSNKIESWLRKNGVKRDIRVIPNGIDQTRFVARDDRSFLVDAGFVNHGDFVLMTAGRLGKEKGIDRLIEALAEYPGVRGSNIKLLIVGDGPYRSDLEALTEKLKMQENVVFTGYIESTKMHKVYPCADIFAFLSRSETQGLVVAEAISVGLPVVVVRDGAFEGMVVDGVNGYYVDTRTDFVHKLRELVSNPNQRSEFGENSIKISKNFSIESSVKAVLEYYEYGLGQWSTHRGIRTTVRYSSRKVIDFLKKSQSEVVQKLKEYV